MQRITLFQIMFHKIFLIKSNYYKLSIIASAFPMLTYFPMFLKVIEEFMK